MAVIDKLRTIAIRAPGPISRVMDSIYKNIYLSYLGRGYRVYDLGDFRMKLNIHESEMMAQRRFRSYESVISEQIVSELDLGDTYVDIGSNHGYHVLEAADQVGTSGRVICFEPNPNNFKILKENIELNKFDQVHPYPYAVCDRDEEISFASGEKSGWGQIDETGEHRVKGTTFDTFCTEHPLSPNEIDLVKIDVEGEESAVLDGMNDFLSRSDDCLILIEVHDDVDIEHMASTLIESNTTFEKLTNEFWRVEV